jgi:hypothetical protein
MPYFFKQRINQWLCLALIGLMCFWTVLYYLSNKVEAIGASSVEQRESMGL